MHRKPYRPWFSGNYTLAILPDPVNHIHYRPLSVDNQDWSDILDHEAALIRCPAQIVKNPNSLPPSSLIVDLSGLEIRAHPLMSEEHVLARTLQDLVTTMQSRKKTHLVPFLFQKVLALQEAFAECKKQFDVLKTAKIDTSSTENLHSLPSTPKLKLKHAAESKLKARIFESRDGLVRLLQEILSARQLRDTEAQTSRLLEYRIIKTWDRIKVLRTAQGFSSTPVKLYIKTRVVEDKVEYRKEAELEVYYKNQLWDLENLEARLEDTAGPNPAQALAQQGEIRDTDPLLFKTKSSNQRRYKGGKLGNYMGRSVEHLESFQGKKVRENALRRLKACYPSQPELEFRMDALHPITNLSDCPHVWFYSC